MRILRMHPDPGRLPADGGTVARFDAAVTDDITIRGLHLRVNGGNSIGGSTRRT